MQNFLRFSTKLAVVALAASTLSLPVTSGVAAAAQAQLPPPISRSVCVNAHIQNIGWQGWRCSRDGSPVFVGTTGQSLRLEALTIRTRGTGGVCAQAHVQNIGWQPARCGGPNDSITVGTVGQSLRLEALRLRTRTGICARAHVQNIGWQRWSCNRMPRPVFVGTVGQSLRLEALNVRV
jgi:uncharacterized protein YjdB